MKNQDLDNEFYPDYFPFESEKAREQWLKKRGLRQNAPMPEELRTKAGWQDFMGKCRQFNERSKRKYGPVPTPAQWKRKLEQEGKL